MTSSRRTAAALAGLAALCIAATAFAAQAAQPLPLEQRLSPEQLRATGLDTLSPRQLALLNQLLAHEQARQANAAGAASVASDGMPPPGAPAAVAAGTGVAQANLFAGAQDGPFEGRLVGEVAGWAPGTVFTFEDGQQWQVLKGELRLPEVRQSPQVVVVPGAMGRWFLQVDEDLPKARVQRIR
jgi:hypothetical protein